MALINVTNLTEIAIKKNRAEISHCHKKAPKLQNIYSSCCLPFPPLLCTKPKQIN